MVVAVANVQEQSEQRKLKCVYIDKDIHRMVKSRSAENGQTMQEYCEDVLRKKLDTEQASRITG